ncbi:MAG: hypothetical protein ACI8RZ_000916 [Myxococcota bacterium]|jgi:hypothetical protein
MPQPPVDLTTPLSLRTSFSFPLQHKLAKREVLIGAAWLLVPVVGWLMNMGHRIKMVHNMHAGRPAWPAWGDSRFLLRHGAITFAGMAYYGTPGVGLVVAGLWADSAVLIGVGVLLWVGAVVAIPGYMTHYCRALDPAEIFNPFRALGRVAQGGSAYWRAWGIALTAMALSFLGLLLAGVGFLATSVWFWQVAGFSFATVFTAQLPEPDET